MRDIFITLLFLYGLWQTLKQPYKGVLVWSWLGYMNPHRLCWGFAYSLPLSYIIALATTGVYFFSKERKTLPNDKLVFLLILFIVWMGATSAFAFNADSALNYYIRILKIQFPIFMTLLMFNDKQRLHQLLWVIVFSIGYFAIKGGVFTLLTAGAHRVYGPPDSFVEENNALAVASLMIIPLMIYLRSTLTKQWQKQLLLFCIFAMVFSAVGSQSRGAFLAILAVGGYFWLQSNRKIVSALVLVVLVIVFAAFLPDSWYERMGTINNYQSDQSSMERIRAWTLAYNVANHNFFGGGFGLWTIDTYSRYDPTFLPQMGAYVAHSIYFHVLGEHGWIGLALFLSCFFLAWRRCVQVITICKRREDARWLAELAAMIRLSLLAYFAGGAFLSLSYFDLPWHLLAITVLLKEQAIKLVGVEGKMTKAGLLNKVVQKNANIATVELIKQ